MFLYKLFNKQQINVDHQISPYGKLFLISAIEIHLIKEFLFPISNILLFKFSPLQGIDNLNILLFT